MPSQMANYLPYNNKPKIGPITDLIETEEEYLDDLQCLLQVILYLNFKLYQLL